MAAARLSACVGVAVIATLTCGCTPHDEGRRGGAETTSASAAGTPATVAPAASRRARAPSATSVAARRSAARSQLSSRPRVRSPATAAGGIAGALAREKHGRRGPERWLDGERCDVPDAYHDWSWKRVARVSGLGEQAVVFTVDGGLDLAMFERGLDVLEAHQVRATFFVMTGPMESDPRGAAILRRLEDAGHELGNHTVDHPRLTSKPDAVVRAQLLDADRYVQGVLGRSVRPFAREPYLAHDARTDRILRELCYRPVWFTIYSRDDQEGVDADAIVDAVLNDGDRPREIRSGSIVLFHASKEATVEAWPRLITELRRRGYAILPLGEALRRRGERKKQRKLTTASSPASVPSPSGEPTAAGLSRLTDEATAALEARYMAHRCRATTHPGWDGYPLQRCRYRVTDRGGRRKAAEVIMLNPSPAQLARWLVSTCAIVATGGEAACADRLLRRVLQHSGAQFPVAGLVLEDIRPADGVFETYCFRDGVSVTVAGFQTRTTHEPTAAETELCMRGEVTGAAAYARLQGTTPDEYRAAGGSVDVGTAANRKVAWLDVSRTAYQAAWGQDRNKLMIAWARQNRETLR